MKRLRNEVAWIENSAGERERERSSRLFNLLEIAVLYGSLMIALWFFIGYLGTRGPREWPLFDYVAYVIFAAAGVWALILSPLLHRDTLHGLGVCRPMEIFTTLAKTDGRGKTVVGVTAALLGIFFFLAIFGDIDHTMSKVGMDRANDRFLDYHGMPTAMGYLLGLAATVFLWLSCLFFLLRFDNFTVVWRDLAVLTIVVESAIILSAMAYAARSGEWNCFREFKLLAWNSQNFISHVGIYTLWAMLQLWLFLGYFNTRLRKGLPRFHRGPLRSEHLTALMTGLLFGLIHLPNPALMAITFFGGCVFGYYFQYDRYRNLFVMAFIMGVAGTLLQQLTPLDGQVGPSALHPKTNNSVDESHWNLAGLPKKIEFTPNDEEEISTAGRGVEVPMPDPPPRSDIHIEVLAAPQSDGGNVVLAVNNSEIGQWRMTSSSRYRALIPQGLMGVETLRLTIEPVERDNALQRLVVQEIMLWEDSLPYGQAIRFGKHGCAEIYQKSGWSFPEEEFTWTEGRRAELTIPVQEPTEDLRLEACVSPLCCKPKLTKQRIAVYAGAQKLGNWLVSGQRTKTVDIPRDAVVDSRLHLIFELPNAASPSSLGVSADQRVLALAFRYLMITKKSDAPPSSR